MVSGRHSAGPSESNVGRGGGEGQPVIGDGCGIGHLAAFSTRSARLLNVINGVVDKGSTVMVIKHQMNEITPEGDAEGGTIGAEGTSEDIAAVPKSYTGKFLAEVVGRAGTSASGPQRPNRRREFSV